MQDSIYYMTLNTPGNVVRGNQKLCKGNLYGCGHDL